MKKTVRKIVPIIAAATMLLSYGCSGNKNKDFATEKTTSEPIKTVKLEFKDIAREIEYTAHLQAYKEVDLAPAAPGRIEKIYVNAGDNVKEGDVIAQMDKTQLHQATLQLQRVEEDYHRLDTLRKVGSIAKQQFDQIYTQYQVAKSNVEFLAENTKLLAPFAGTVSNKYFENGEMFSGAPNTQAGKAAIVSIIQSNRLKVYVNVSESYYREIKSGMKAQISTSLYTNEIFEGTITNKYPEIDPATRTFKVEIVVPNNSLKLRPGMFAKAKMILEQANAFVVPAYAVLKLQGSNERYIFIDNNGIARRVVVEMGERFDDMVEIISDKIKEGDMLIYAGHSRLSNGATVNIVQ